MTIDVKYDNTRTEAKVQVPRGRLIASLLFIILLGELAAASYILVATALPKIAAYYQTTDIAWSMTIVGIASGMIIGITGKLADMRGKRMVLVALILVATAGCVISALAPNYALFLLGRALQGCLYLVPAVGFSLIRDVFPKKFVSLGIAMVFTGSGIVYVFAPFLAGWLIESFGVLSVFWFCAIFQLFCIIGLVLTVPESPIRVPARLNWVGALLFGFGSVAVMYAIGQGMAWGWVSLPFVGVLAAGIACFVGWIRWDSRFSDPLVDLDLLRSKRMSTTLLVTFLGFAVGGPIGAILPGMLQTPRDAGGDVGFSLDAYGVALYMIPMALAITAGGILVGAKARAWGVRWPLIGGLACLAISAVGLATVPMSATIVMVFMAFYGIGQGIATASFPNLMMQATPPESQGISASMQSTTMNLGQALLTQIAFVVLTAHLIPGTDGYFYAGTGYTIAFGLVAGLAVIAIVVCLTVLPHGRRADVVGAKAGLEEVGA